MSRPSTLLLTGLLLLASAANGAERLETARAAVAQARTQEAELRQQQARLKGELDALGTRIEALKAQPRGTLLPGGELDASLKRSQELSGSLTGLATALERASAEVERANAALISALSYELTRLRAAWDRGGREERAKLVGQMRRLRAERESLRAALPAAQVPALLPAPSSDDPEELLEQADALRDAEDKVRKRVAALEARIVEAREELELDRRMGEFSSEGAVFDEQDRRLQLDRNPSGRTTQLDAYGNSPASAAEMSAGSAGGSGGSSQDSTGRIVGRPPSPVLDGRGLASDGDDLKSLEVQRDQLRKLAAELEEKAAQAEARARALQ